MKEKLCRPSRRPARALAAALAVLLSLSSCALLQAGRNVEEVFLAEEDLVIAEASLPVLIKASEALLSGSPGDRGKAVTTASLYIMYASAFVSGPADLLPDEEYEAKGRAARRAQALYKRAGRLLLPLLEARAPGFLAAESEDEAAGLLSRFRKDDLPLLYWTAASLLGSFSIDPLSFEGAKGLLPARRLLARASALDPAWNAGALEELNLSLYASLPDYMGGSLAEAEKAYLRALEYSGGKSASVYVTYATSVAVVRDDYAAFKDALRRALAVDPEALPGSRLPNALARDRAERLLAQPERYFLIVEGDDSP